MIMLPQSDDTFSVFTTTTTASAVRLTHTETAVPHDAGHKMKAERL